MAGALDTIELSPDVRNHRGVKRRKGKKGADKAGDIKPAKEEPIVPTPELTEEETAKSTTPARDAMRQLEREEGRRRRAPQEVPTDETLRVAPVDQRPEFIAQGKVDDSQTRIFGKLTKDAVMAHSAEEAEAPAEKEPAAQAEKKAEEAPAASAEETIRLSRSEIDEIRQQDARRDAFEGKGKKRSEIKPMKKKKNGFFGRRKDDEDDFVEDIGADDDFTGDDDDFFE